MKYELTQDKREEIIGAFECQITDDVVNNARGFDVIGVSIEIRREDVIKKFDPNSWNEYPEVTPEQGVRYRVEVYEPSFYDGPEITKEKIVEARCGHFNGRHFEEFEQPFSKPILAWGDQRIRFRLWDG